jgi:hypothetical protein
LYKSPVPTTKNPQPRPPPNDLFFLQPDLHHPPPPSPIPTPFSFTFPPPSISLVSKQIFFSFSIQKAAEKIQGRLAKLAEAKDELRSRHEKVKADIGNRHHQMSLTVNKYHDKAVTSLERGVNWARVLQRKSVSL